MNIAVRIIKIKYIYKYFDSEYTVKSIRMDIYI